MSKLILLENIKIEYENELIIFIKELEIKNSRILLLTGPNGCGKTSLLEYIANSSNLKEKNITIFNNFLPKDDIFYFPSNFPLPDFLHFTEINQLAKIFYHKDLKELGDLHIRNFINNLQKKKIENLSNGEKQKILLLFMLLGKKKLNILDEAENHLDKENVAFLCEIISLLLKEGKSFIIATHMKELFLGNKDLVKHIDHYHLEY